MIQYEVNVKTSNLSVPSNDSVYISFIGTRITTPYKILSENGFNLNSNNQFIIESIDIGILYGIKVKIVKFAYIVLDSITVRINSNKS